MIESDDARLSFAGLMHVETRALRDDECAWVARFRRGHVRTLRIWLVVIGTCVGALGVGQGLEASGLARDSAALETVSMVTTIGGCFLVPVSLVGLAFAYDAWVRSRRLGRDLADGRARVFSGAVVASGDSEEVVRGLIDSGRVPANASGSPEGVTTAPATELALLASGTVVPAHAGERLVRYLARPFLLAVGPCAPTPAGETRALGPAEIAELERHARALRGVSLSQGLALTMGSMATLALALGAPWRGPSGFALARTAMAVVFALVGALSTVRLVLQRSEARTLDRARRGGRVLGTAEGEELPGGVPWRVGERPASWRRS